MNSQKPRKTLQEMARETARIESGLQGIACPVCGCRDTRVQTTRRSDDVIVRYRICRHCGRHRVTLES